jgi:hypothetical protein
MKILLRDFNAKTGREDIIKLTIGNEGLHQDSNGNDVRRVHFYMPKNLLVVVKGMMLPYRNFNKYTRTSPDRKTHNKI